MECHEAAVRRQLDGCSGLSGKVARDLDERVKFAVLPSDYGHLFPLVGVVSNLNSVAAEGNRRGNNTPHALGPPSCAPRLLTLRPSVEPRARR